MTPAFRMLVAGLAPAAGQCSATTVGAQAESDHTADYYFWKAGGSS